MFCRRDVVCWYLSKKGLFRFMHKNLLGKVRERWWSCIRKGIQIYLWVSADFQSHYLSQNFVKTYSKVLDMNPALQCQNPELCTLNHPRPIHDLWPVHSKDVTLPRWEKNCPSLMNVTQAGIIFPPKQFGRWFGRGHGYAMLPLPVGGPCEVVLW